MSKDPESVPFVRRVLQISQTGERWLLLARHAAIVDRYAYSNHFPRVRQVLFAVFFAKFLKQFLRKADWCLLLKRGERPP
jgi:hypothetical protein